MTRTLYKLKSTSIQTLRLLQLLPFHPRHQPHPQAYPSHLHPTLPTDLSSYTDGTTILTDSQIQQDCTFVDEHISIPPARDSIPRLII